ncbi:MAG: ABC transporter permease [Planctomycetales bacterium]|nr:ABC transporter permease [Planctomycetales bacterium]
MDAWLTVRIALRALAKNKLRAGLTVLGVVIGIAAVTTMVSIGMSASALVQGQLETLGTNVIVIFPEMREQGGVRQNRFVSLTAADSEAIAAECENVRAASPLVGAGGQVIYGRANWAPNEMLGVGVDYLTVRNWPVEIGGFFTERDISSADKVCVIGKTMVRQLFQTINPIGETIRVRNIPFRVIGVLEGKGANIVGEDQDNILLMPYTTVRKRLQGSNFDDVHVIMVSARASNRMQDAVSEIDQLLMDRHRIAPGEPPDFTVKSTTEISNMLGMITGVMTSLLASIAGISLLVGGVGIMNIMLVSVTERTREIGIRMAVGATGRDILRQFLIESVILSCVGGILGLLLGIGASTGVTMAINSWTRGTKWPVVVSLPAAFIAIAFAALVGIFFGYYPARRASRMDPIEALRYE